MKKATKWNFKSIAGRILLGLVLVSMIGSIDVVPAIGKDNHKQMGRHDNGRYENRGPGYDHGRNYRPYGHYGHRERVYYPPPPVVYAPPPPPGISIFFPPLFIRP